MTDIVERLRDYGSNPMLRSPYAMTMHEAADEIERLRAELAQRGEPVAHLTPPFGGLMVNHNWKPPSGMQWPPKEAVPLYTAPPKRQPLADQVILDLADTHLYNGGRNYDVLAFGRAIERAHGIGGDDE